MQKHTSALKFLLYGCLIKGGNSVRYSSSLPLILVLMFHIVYSCFFEVTQQGTTLCASTWKFIYIIKTRLPKYNYITVTYSTWTKGISSFSFSFNSSTHFIGVLRGRKSHTTAPILWSMTHWGKTSGPIPPSKWNDMFNLSHSSATFSKPRIKYCIFNK